MKKNLKKAISLILVVVMVMTMLPLQSFAFEGGDSIILPIGDNLEDISESDALGFRSMLQSSITPIYISYGAVSTTLPEINKPETMTSFIEGIRIQAVDDSGQVVAQTSSFNLNGYEESIGYYNKLFLLDVLNEGSYNLQVVYGDVQNPTKITLDYALTVVDAPVITYGSLLNLSAGINEFQIDLGITGYDGNADNFSFSLIDESENEIGCTVLSNNVTSNYDSVTRITYYLVPLDTVIADVEYSLKLSVASGSLYASTNSISTVADETSQTELAILEVVPDDNVVGGMIIKVGGVNSESNCSISVVYDSTNTSSSESADYSYIGTVTPLMENGNGIFNIVLSKNNLTLPLSAYGTSNFYIKISDNEGNEDAYTYRNESSYYSQYANFSLEKMTDTTYKYVLVGHNILLNLYETSDLTFELKKVISNEYTQVGISDITVNKRSFTDNNTVSYEFSGIMNTEEALSRDSYYIFFENENITGTYYKADETTAGLQIDSLSMPCFDYSTNNFFFNFDQFPLDVTLIDSSSTAVAKLYDLTTSQVVSETVAVSGTLNSDGNYDFSFILSKPMAMDINHDYTIQFVTHMDTNPEMITISEYVSNNGIIHYDDEVIIPSYYRLVTPIFVGDQTLSIDLSGWGNKNMSFDYFRNTPMDIVNQANDTSLVYSIQTAIYQNNNNNWLLNLDLDKPIAFGNYKYFDYNEFQTILLGTSLLGDTRVDSSTKIISISNCENLNAMAYTAVLYDTSENGFGKLTDLTLTQEDATTLVVSEALPIGLANGTYTMKVYADGVYLGSEYVYVSWNSDVSTTAIIKGYHLQTVEDYVTLKEINYQTDKDQIFLYTHFPGYSHVRYSEDESFEGVNYSSIQEKNRQQLTLSAGDGLKTIYVQFKSPTGVESKIYALNCEKVTQVIVPKIIEAWVSKDQTEVIFVPDNSEFTINLIASSQLSHAYFKFTQTNGNIYYTSYPLTYIGLAEGGYLFQKTLNSSTSPFKDSYYEFDSVGIYLEDLTGKEYDFESLPIFFNNLENIYFSGWSSYGGVEYTNQPSYAVVGYATPNSTVVLSYDGENYSGQTNDVGRFSIMVNSDTEGTFRITAQDSSNLTSNNDASYYLSFDQTAPTIDTLKATTSDGNVVLTWTTSSNDVAYYLIWKDGAAVKRASDNYVLKSYMSAGAFGSTFKVVAVDRTGNLSEALEVSVGDEVPPTKPGIPIIYTQGTTKLSFGWTPSTDNVAVYQYAVYRNDVLIDTLSYAFSNYTDTGLSEGTTYDYKIYALDRAGNQSEAAHAQLSTATLNISSSISFSSEYVKEERPNGVSVSLSLSNSDSSYLDDVTAKLQYKLNTEADWSELPLSGFSTSRNGTWIIEDLLVGTYTVRFYVVDNEGTEKTSTEATVAISQDSEPPVSTLLVPTDGSTIGGRELKISGSSTDNVEVDRIVLSYSLDGGTSFTGITTMTNENTFNRISYSWNYTFDASTLPSGDLIIKALAYDGRGNTAADFVTVDLDNIAPVVPESFYVSGDKDKITVLWQYPDLEGGNDFSHFRVYRSTTASGEFTLVKDELASIGYHDTVNTGIVKELAYFYYVTAVDDYGNESARTLVMSGQLIDDDESPLIRSMIPESLSRLQKTAMIKVSATDNYMLDKCVIDYKRSDSDTWIPLVTLKNDTISRSHIYSHTWDVADLSAGSYDVKVSVYDKSGYIAIENKSYIVATYSAPEVPVLTARSGGHKTVQLNWNYSGDETTLESFILYRSENGVDYHYISGFSAMSNSYQDKVNFTGENNVYYYKLKAVDAFSASAESHAVNVTAIALDSENPVAVIMPDKHIYAAVGEPLALTASASTDNDGIATYMWNFGDGKSNSGLDVTHVYDAEGNYTVSLIVTDMYGNTNKCFVSVVVVDLNDETADYTKLVLTICDAIDQTAIANAEVVINSPDITETMKADQNGKLTVIVPSDDYTIGIYADGYIVRTITVKAQGGLVEHTIGLSNGSIMGSSFTTSEMTYDEIVAAGIDVEAEGNQHVYKFAVELTFVAGLKSYSLPYTVYKNERNEIVGNGGAGFTSFGGNGGGFGGFNIGIFPITENFVLVIYGEARWLKEMYNVELVVINHSSTDTLDQVAATLELPDGLSLASMVTNAQSLTQELGTIGYSDTATARWYVCGDKEGEFNLTAKVNAVSMPYGEVINKTFTTTTPLKVYAGSALKLKIIADDVAERGKDYTVKFRLENVSDKSLYNLSFGITGSEQYKVIGIGDKEANLPIDSADYGENFTHKVAELAPGGYFEMTLSTTIWFNSVLELVEFSKLGAFVDVAYYLTDVSVVALEGSTTVIPHEIVVNKTEKKSFIGKLVFDTAKEKWGIPSFSLADTLVEVVGKALDLKLGKSAKTIIKLMQGETDHKMVISIDDGIGNHDSIYNEVVEITTGSKSQSAIDMLNGTKLKISDDDVYIQAKGPGSTKLKIGIENLIGEIEREFDVVVNVEDQRFNQKLTLVQDEITGAFMVNKTTLNSILETMQKEEKEAYTKNPYVWFDSQLIFDINDTARKDIFEFNISGDSLKQILLETVTNKLTIDGSVADLDFDRDALKLISNQIETMASNPEVTVIARQLSETEAIALGSNRPTYQFLAMVAEEVVSNFGNGSVTVSLPYQLQAGELSKNLFVERVHENGTVDRLNATYEEGAVTFESDSFSYYRIGYTNKITPMGTPTVSGEITNGQPLSKLSIAVIMKDGQIIVPGTIKWSNPDVIPLVGSHTQDWVFTPTDTDKYSVVQGTILVNVSNIKERNSDETYSSSSNDESVNMKPEGEIRINDKLSLNVPSGTVVDKDGSMVIPADKDLELVLLESGANVVIVGGCSISTDGTITVGEGTASITTKKDSEVIISRGSTISGAIVTLGAEGAKAQIRGTTYAYEENDILILDEDVPLGFIVMYQESYSDVSETDWYYEAVKNAYEHSIMQGTNKGFEPSAKLTRSMLVQMLYNLEGRPSSSKSVFNDVVDGSWYANAIAWASDNIIVKGNGKNQFAPKQVITREQMAIILHNYCLYKGIVLPVLFEGEVFTDKNEVSSWAVQATEAMYKAGILRGKGNGKFDPKGMASRAEVAQMFMNFMNVIK